VKKLIVSIEQNERIINIECQDGENLLDVLRKEGVSVPAYCNGNGTCRKCKVMICEMNQPEDKEDDRVEEVLACEISVTKNIRVYIPEISEVTDVSLLMNENKPEHNADGQLLDENDKVYIVVDLGTTTVAAGLYKTDGTLIRTVSEMNCLENYGADVISRTQYIISHENGLEELSGKIRQQADRLVAELVDEIKHTGSDNDVRIIRKLLAGNTIMQHIFAGISPESISRAPFTPSTLFEEEYLVDGYEMTPCVAGYVGGDIVSGLFYLDNADMLKGNVLFLDIGTNGEMGLFSNGEIHTAAVACGPAFEGGQISCGMTGTVGAIDRVYVDKKGHPKLRIHVIGEESNPEIQVKGICGSGLLDLAAALLELGIIDETGYLDEDVMEEQGLTEQDVIITQKDVRMLQLAKAAVRAGMDTLLHECGLEYNDIDSLYIAGGFGTYLDKKSAAKIGMIPSACIDKTQALGNTSLKGLAGASLSEKPTEEFLGIKNMCSYIELSGNKLFEELYIERMSFEEEE